MKFVDLSHPVNDQTPVYPGDPEIKITKAGVLEKDGYQDHLVCIGTHVGTHIDAPAHMIAGGKNLDQIPVSNFIGRGVYIKVNNEFRFEDYPVMSHKISNYLVEKRVKMVGVDACSVDVEESFPMHKILLHNDVLIIENLTNLAELAGKQFRVYVLPLKLEVDGAPARVIAEVV